MEALGERVNELRTGLLFLLLGIDVENKLVIDVFESSLYRELVEAMKAGTLNPELAFFSATLVSFLVNLL